MTNLSLSRSRNFALAVVVLATSSVALLMPQTTEAKVVVKLEKSKIPLDEDIEMTVSGLKKKTTYLITVSTSDDTVEDCAASGTYENGQVVDNASKRSDSKGRFEFTLSPQSALGENWCQSTYNGKIKQSGKSSTLARFTFKAKVGV